VSTQVDSRRADTVDPGLGRVADHGDVHTLPHELQDQRPYEVCRDPRITLECAGPCVEIDRDPALRPFVGSTRIGPAAALKQKAPVGLKEVDGTPPAASSAAGQGSRDGSAGALGDAGQVVSLAVMAHMGRILQWPRPKAVALATGINAFYGYERLGGWRRMTSLRMPDVRGALGAP
jgi:hypothetical protein